MDAQSEVNLTVTAIQLDMLTGIVKVYLDHYPEMATVGVGRLLEKLQARNTEVIAQIPSTL